MTSFKFKTNINCSGCVKSVKGFLNEVKGLKNWEVDTSSSDKVLTVESDPDSIDEVIAAVEEAGFEIYPLLNQN
jgi:copper chaperone